MANLGHDAVFVEDAAALRPRLEACARVLYPSARTTKRPDSPPPTAGDHPPGGSSSGDRAVDQALARTYVLGADGDRTVAAFRALLHPSWVGIQRRTSSERVELVDVAQPHGGDLAGDLAALGPVSQAVVVLTLLGGVGRVDLGRIIGAPVAQVSQLYDDAVERLGRTDPSRADPDELTRQLGRLAGRGDPVSTARDGVGDLSRGRRLAQRTRRRRAAATVATLAVVALIAGFIVRTTTPGDVAQAPVSPPSPSSSIIKTPDPGQSYRCNRNVPDCRTLTVARWRSRMSDVIVQHLDRRRSYFSSMTWGLRPDARSESYWRGEGGALATGLSRGTGGGTEVYLQIATDERYADGCGARIKKHCEAFTTMDGNNYRVAGTSVERGGVEVQYYAEEDVIITLVARNTSEGKTLDVSSSDLIKLVNDSRLRLPRR